MICGYRISFPQAYENGGIARDGAKMVNAVSCVDVARSFSESTKNCDVF